MSTELDRRDVIAHRIHAQQLDSEPATRSPTDPVVLDLGVQDSGSDSASWALANRGARLAGPGELQESAEFALAWTVRGAPHVYRRRDLPGVQIATSPWSDADAGKRIFDANRPLKAAGIGARQALTEVATQMRDLVTAPLVKGAMSGALAERMPEPYLRFCVPCQLIHLYEMPFRLAALHAGLELEPGTSPPVLRPVPNWPDRAPGPAADPNLAPGHLQPIRGCLRLLDPTTPADVAGYLDAPVGEIKKHWPEDAVEVTVDGRPAWTLDPALGRSEDVVRLLGPFDLLLQGRDRRHLVPDVHRHKELWPTLGRPGAVLVGTNVLGSGVRWPPGRSSPSGWPCRSQRPRQCRRASKRRPSVWPCTAG